jgi:hypothetical protein
MTRAARARKKANRARAGRHTGAQHAPGMRCPVCKPPKKKWDRSQEGKAV